MGAGVSQLCFSFFLSFFLLVVVFLLHIKYFYVRIVKYGLSGLVVVLVPMVGSMVGLALSRFFIHCSLSRFRTISFDSLNCL